MQQQNWWDEAPIVGQAPQQEQGEDWWKAAPVVGQPQRQQAAQPIEAAPQQQATSDYDPISGEYVPDDGIPVNPDLTARMAQPYGDGSSREAAIDLSGDLYADQVGALKQGAWVRTRGGEVYQLPGDAFFENPRATDEIQNNAFFVRRPNMQDRVAAGATAFSEQVPFGDEAIAGIAGALNGRGYDAAREQQMLDRQLLNQTERGARVVGGVSGAVLPALALPGAGWVNSAQGIGKIGRAAALGAGYGAGYGFANTDGGLQERGLGAGVGAGSGFFTGGALQGVGNALSRSGVNAAANPSPQRQLSRMGVELTPGQMAGGWVQTVEDAVAGTIPILGDSINAARRRGLESFDNVATNIALEPIGTRISNTSGRQGVRAASEAVSNAYNNALGNVTIATDQAFDAGLQAALQPQGLTPTIRRNLAAITDNILDPLKNGPVAHDALPDRHRLARRRLSGARPDPVDHVRRRWPPEGR